MRLEEVFKISGVPEATFVRPSRFNTLLTNLRTPGRGLVVEGPSGIGKTTAVKQALAEIGLADAAQILSGRRPADVDLLRLLPTTEDFGVVVVDDFHVLPDDLRQEIADLLKALADAESAKSKIVVIGINKAGDTLIQHAPDVANRLDILKIQAEPPEKIDGLIALGEAALNVSLAARQQIVEAAAGSFYIAQMLCHETCVEAGVLVAPPEHLELPTPFSRVKRLVMERQEMRFDRVLTKFTRGTKFRPGGRAPYLTILRWLAEAESWAIDLEDEMARHPKSRASVRVVLKKEYLANLVADPDISQILHLEASTNVLSIEDPHVAFYIRNLDMHAFAKQVGFRKMDFTTEYDVALSFAGEDRAFASALYDHLEDLGLVVFYDLNEQARILGEDLERFFAPIYEADADFVVAVLGPTYGTKRWTRFESAAFEARFSEGHVIPVWSKAVPEVVWDKSRSRGGCVYDPDEPLDSQAKAIAGLIADKVGEVR